MSLYEKFRSWSEGGSVWIISDPHFDDEDCKLMDPEWPSPEEQINIINHYVKSSDTLIILGDIGSIKYVKMLKAGRKILICGNHDLGVKNYLRRSWVEDLIILKKGPDGHHSIVEDRSEEFKNKEDFICFSKNTLKPLAFFDNKLFDEVYSGPIFISDRILLSHEPFPQLPYIMNIHGHDHSGVFEEGPYSRNVASNVVKYKPINLGALIKDGLLKDVENIHRLTIDDATKRKAEREGVKNE